MQTHEYLALPAPRKGSKVKGLKTPAERFAHAVTELLNEVAAEGWEFWRSETLPSEERKGLTGTAVVENHLMIFRRPSAEALAEHPRGQETAPETSRSPDVAAPRIQRSDPILLDRPSSDQPIYESRREPMFRSQSAEAGERS